MRPILVVDCSGSMHAHHGDGDGPLHRIICNVRKRYPPDTPWVAVTMERLHRGTLADIDRVHDLPGGWSEIASALSYALVPGFMPIICTDDGDDMQDVADMVAGRDVELVIVRSCRPTGSITRYEAIGRTTTI